MCVEDYLRMNVCQGDPVLAINLCRHTLPSALRTTYGSIRRAAETSLKPRPASHMTVSFPAGRNNFFTYSCPDGFPSRTSSNLLSWYDAPTEFLAASTLWGRKVNKRYKHLRTTRREEKGLDESDSIRYIIFSSSIIAVSYTHLTLPTKA